MSGAADEDMILRQRTLSRISAVSQELTSDSIEEKEAKGKDNLIKREIEFAKLGYQTAITYFRENHNVFKSYELLERKIHLSIDDCVIKKSDLEILSDLKAVSKIVSEKSTLQNLWKIPTNVLMAYYLISENLIDQKKNLDALHVFSFLTFVNPNIQSFWIGRGRADELLENWEQALNHYRKALALNPKNPSSYEGLARIYKKLGETKALSECVDLVMDSPELKEKILSKGR